MKKFEHFNLKFLTFLKLIGLSDWAFRLPVALLGASMVSAVYLSIERIFSRNDAVLAALHARGLGHLVVAVGGLIPPEDETRLLKAGVARVFTPVDVDIYAILRELVSACEQAYPATR